jgi:hypothetical protein
LFLIYYIDIFDGITREQTRQYDNFTRGWCMNSVVIIRNIHQSNEKSNNDNDNKKVNTVKNNPNHRIHTSTSSKIVILSCLFPGNTIKDINIIYQEQLSISVLNFLICVQYIRITSKEDHYCSVFYSYCPTNWFITYFS